jgi:hypothetical protein
MIGRCVVPPATLAGMVPATACCSVWLATQRMIRRAGMAATASVLGLRPTRAWPARATAAQGDRLALPERLGDGD